MSNFYITLTHKETGQVHNILAIDNYFGNSVYGYEIPGGKVLKADELDRLYERPEND